MPGPQGALSSGRRRGQVEPIRVAVRLRPLRKEDGHADRSDGNPVWKIERINEQQWVYLSPGTPRIPLGVTGGSMSSSMPSLPPTAAGTPAPLRGAHDRARFSFDLCFDGKCTNDEVFGSAARDIVRSPFEGVNATVLAYGQTSSGKTHSILGTLREPGILPTAMRDLWAGGGGDTGRMSSFVARVSYFEIFNERVRDLITPGDAQLPVKEDAGRGFFVQGLSENPVSSADDVLTLIKRGEERRRYAQTRWNEYSSRSHVLFTLTLERVTGSPVNHESEAEAGSPSSLPALLRPQSAKLSIVDLAGCENHKFEQSEDGRYINRSLFFLGEVISRLCNAPGGKAGPRATSGRRTREGTPSRRGFGSACSDPLGGSSGAEGSRSGRPEVPGTPPSRGRDVTPVRHSREGTRSPSASRARAETKNEFIPYRDSKLTRILRSSLGGNALTCLLVTVHPSWQFVEQSLTSLRFASKARCVENFVQPGQEVFQRVEERNTISAQQRIIEGLQHKVMSLERERGPQRGQGDTPPDARRALARQGAGASGTSGVPPESVFQDMADKGLLDQWMLGQFRGMKVALEEKEQQLAAKTQLLSEREEQLSRLHESLGQGSSHSGHHASGQQRLRHSSSRSGHLASEQHAQIGEIEASQYASQVGNHVGHHAGRQHALRGDNESSQYTSQSGSHGGHQVGRPHAQRDVNESVQYASQGGSHGSHHGGGQYVQRVGNEHYDNSPEAPVARYGPPDEGGGLPVVDCGRYPSTGFSASAPSSGPTRCGAQPQWERGPSGSGSGPGPGAYPSWGDVVAAGNGEGPLEDGNAVPAAFQQVPTAFQQIHSRAEDIVCLRRSERYVSRQNVPIGVSSPAVAPSPLPPPPGRIEQTPDLPPVPSFASAPTLPPGGGDASGGGRSKNELTDKLLYMAVKHINSIKSGPCDHADGDSVDDVRPPSPPRTRPEAFDAPISRGSGPIRGGGASAWPPPPDWQQGLDAADAGPSAGVPSRGASTWAAPSPPPVADPLDLPPPSNPNVEGTPRRGGWDLDGDFDDLDDLSQHPAPPFPPFGAGEPRNLASLWERRG